MATRTKIVTKGVCDFCNGEFEKAKMTQHLKYCKQRVAAITAETGEGAKQKQRLFHIQAEGRYNPQYWMHLEILASEPLFALDSFFRAIWVECCDHLSAFEIGGTDYADEPGDFSFEIVGAEVQEGEVEEDEEEEEAAEDEEEEDLSPEELAAEIGKILDAEPPEWRNMLPDEMQVELRKPRSRDDLVAFLKEKMNSMPKRISVFTSENIDEQRRLYFQKSTLKFLLDMVEDRTLGVPLEKLLKVGQKFTYEYDFGSTTELNLKVVSERDGVVHEGEDDPITILARNVPPVILCKVCGKPATKVASGYFNVEENAYCNKCARRSKDAEMLLPVVNSPRVGVCGYTG